MSGNFLFDWAALAVSLFNTMLSFWLGLTVLLNAERRTRGLWFASTGLLLAGCFFLSHTAILGLEAFPLGSGLDFWWTVGWFPVSFLPFAWYAVMLWYNGFWNQEEVHLQRRHRPWFLLTLLMVSSILGLLIFAHPLPSAVQIVQNQFTTSPGLSNTPLLLVLYPFYALFCMGLALDVVLHPVPSNRVMGDLGRRRARPWLVGATLALLLVSLLVGGVTAWTAAVLNNQTSSVNYMSGVVGFDLAIDSLISICLLLLGQAIVSYEVFTGKSLPRRGLLRYWQRAVILAGGYGLVAAWGLQVPLHPVYNVLLGVALVSIFYALLSWRAFAERERYIQNLRPFVTSQRLYDQILVSKPQADALTPDVQAPFRALCEEVLETRSACLIPLGSLAALAGDPLYYPEQSQSPPMPSGEWIASLNQNRSLCLRLDPQFTSAATWAVPLWRETGLAGAMLLGVKRDGALYTQEEIEISRTVGERLVDIQASAEMAKRLMALQRQHLTESQVLDRHTRRVIHDEILPQLHTALLTLSAVPSTAGSSIASVQDSLAALHSQISNLLRELPYTAAPQVRQLGLIAALQQIIETEYQHAFDQVEWHITSQAESQSNRLPPLVGEVMFYAAREALRNAVRHARPEDESQPIKLDIQIDGADGLRIAIQDNGPGLAKKEAANSSDSIGSGQGLALHSTMMAVIGGTLEVSSSPGVYTRVTLALPGAAIQPASLSTS